MTYKHIIFDFGNVLAKFDPGYLLGQFCDNKELFPLLKDILFEHWEELDAGTMTPETARAEALSKTPKAYQDLVLCFFENWYRHLLPLEDTWTFICELKERGYGLYILSNAPVDFAAHAEECYEITKLFDGIVFSAPIKMAKPQPEIYKHLFHTYHLSPADCFFLDDKPENIRAAKKVGMDGLVFTGDINIVKERIGF